MIPVLLDCIRSGEPSYQKDSLEYAFRKAILEILHRIPPNEVLRPQASAFFSGMLHIIRIDNEENAILACKVLVELTRTFRPLAEELLKDFFVIFLERCRTLPPLVQNTLSEDSLAIDSATLISSNQSLKVFYEMSLVLYTLLQLQRPALSASVQDNLQTYYEVLELEAPVQKTARENFEAMGNIWSGMAPNIPNQQAYMDFISSQVKVSITADDKSKTLSDWKHLKGPIVRNLHPP